MRTGSRSRKRARPDTGAAEKILLPGLFDRLGHTHINGYILALGATAAAAVIRGALEPFLGDVGQYVAFYVSVALTTLVAGRGPGFTALLLGAASGFAFFVYLPAHFEAESVQDYLHLCLFLAVGGIIVALTSWARLERQNAQERAASLSEALEQRGRSEQRLRVTTDLLEGITEGTSDLIAAYDNDLRVVALNTAFRSAFRQIYGRDIEVGTSLIEALAHLPDERSRSVEPLVRAIGGEAFTFTEEYGDPGLARRIYETRYSPLRDSAGRLVGASVVARDATSRFRSQEQLHESEERFRKLFEAMREGVSIGEVVAAADGKPADVRILDINPSGARMHGSTRDQIVGRTIREFDPAADPNWIETLAGVGRTGEAVSTERYGPFGGKWIQLHAYSPRPGQIAVIYDDITERKRAEQDLRVSEALHRELAEALEAEHAKLATAIESLPVGVGMSDAQGTILSMNRVGLWLHGFSSEREMLSRIDQYMLDFELRYPDGSLMPVEDWPLLRALRADFVNDYEVLLRNKRTGTDRVISYSVAPVRRGDGTVSLIVYVMQDLTESRRARRALYASEGQYRALAENSPEVIARFDRALRHTYVNEYGTKVYGFPKEQVIGRTYAEIGMPDPVVEFWRKHLEEVFTTERQSTVDFEFDSSTLGHQYFSSLLVPEFGDLGEVSSVLVIMRVITERKRWEQALRESEESFRQLADSMPQIVWAARPDGVVDYYNRKWHEYVPDWILLKRDRGWAAVLPPEDRGRVVDAWRRSVRTGEDYQLEVRILHKSGEYRWNLVRALPMRDEAGKITRWFGTSTDIHDQKTTEEALRNEHRRKDDFLAVLGHELRNPLAPIRNAAHILRQVASGEPILQRTREIIDRQVAHLSRLLDDLLDVTRISHGKIQLRKQRVDLASVIRIFAGDYLSTIEGGGLTLDLHLPEHPVWIFGDAARLQQIVGNLLHNAVKFTDPGGKITLRLEDDEDGNSLLTVEDNGIGMEREVLRSIFEPFSQVESSRNRSRGGLGLGLALVKGLAELHGGRVEAESNGPGRGARFLVRLPLENRDSRLWMKQPARPAPGRAHRIVIIEDNEDAAESLEMLLTMLGHEVVVAGNGAEGLRRIRDFRPTAVLCDIGLPGGMDGYEVAHAVRADPQISSTCLIAMTGYGQEQDRRAAYDAGFDHHVTKPADPEDVARLLPL